VVLNNRKTDDAVSNSKKTDEVKETGGKRDAPLLQDTREESTSLHRHVF
jgi:hypothetical protein